MAQPIVVTDANFASEVEGKEGLTIVDFWAAWCGPCRAFAPVFDRFADVYDGRARFAKLDVDANGTIAERFTVRSIPSLLFFADGVLIDRTTGALPPMMLDLKIAETLKRIAGAPVEAEAS